MLDAAEFFRRAAVWDAVASAGGYPPFLQSDFMAACLREFGTGHEVLAILGDDSSPEAMALLANKLPGVWQTFVPSQLPLGAFVRRRPGPIEGILENLLTALPGTAAMVSVAQQDPAIIPRPAETPLLVTLDYIDTARVTIEGAFEEFWAARGKNLRHNIKRQRAKLADDGVVVRVDVVDEAEGVAAAMAEYGRLESAGWKATGGTAIAPNNAQGRFYTSMLEAFCTTGGGRIYRCLFDDKVVAMDLGIERDGVLVVLKTTYDEALKAISPASLMRHEYFQRLFEAQGVTRLEFYGKVMEWHLRWTGDVRMLYHINYYRSPWIKTTHELLRRKGENKAAESTS